MPALNPESWQAVSPYLDEALEMPHSERAIFVASLHQRDPKLAVLLKALLDEHGMATEERFLEQNPDLPLGHSAFTGQTVGAYRLISRIGEGGMGSVWLAERVDGRFERRAAVKFLSFALTGRTSEHRFKREGSILGRLAHPNIAELLDAGVFANGQPYLVLEYVDGEHIDRYCDRHLLDVETRLRLIIDVLAAVSHAHANLVVHRDIKPPNVLVRNDGQVKLLDFGIAKLLEGEGKTEPATMLTHEGGAVLTPAYAAPEQLTGGVVTVATDVYALGVLLFVLLTGSHPAGSGAQSPAGLIKAIVDSESPAPSQVVNTGSSDRELAAAARRTTPGKLERALRGDLDTIVAKALKKNPQERYASANAFADDLQRYLKHQPISAHPDTLAYRTAKFVRRNRVAVALAGLAFVASVAGVLGTTAQARAARVQRDFALRQLSRAETINDLNSFLLSDAAPSGKPFTVDALLARAEQIVRRQSGEDLSRLELLISIGSQYKVQDEYAKARPLLEDAYRASKRLPDRSARARASCGLGQTLSREGEPQRAENLFQEGMHALPDEPIFAADRVTCLLRGSEIAQNRGDPLTGIARAQTAQHLLEQSPYDSELLQLDTQITLAGAYSEAALHAEADAAFERAAKRLAALGRDDTQMAGTVLNNWGVNLILAGRPLEAEKVLRRCIAISRDRESNQTVQAQPLVNYARALHDLGRFDEAADYAEQGYAKARQAGDDAPVGQSLLLRASIYRNKGDLENAVRMLSELEPRLRRNLPSGHIAFGSLAMQRALNAQALGNRQSALQFADQAVAIADALVKNRGQGRDYLPIFLIRRSEIKLQSGQAHAAWADAGRALDLLRRTTPPAVFSSTLGRAWLAAGRALLAEGNRKEAYAAIHSAVLNLQKTVDAAQPDLRAALRLANDPEFSGR